MCKSKLLLVIIIYFYFINLSGATTLCGVLDLRIGSTPIGVLVAVSESLCLSPAHCFEDLFSGQIALDYFRANYPEYEEGIEIQSIKKDEYHNDLLIVSLRKPIAINYGLPIKEASQHFEKDTIFIGLKSNMAERCYILHRAKIISFSKEKREALISVVDHANITYGCSGSPIYLSEKMIGLAIKYAFEKNVIKAILFIENQFTIPSRNANNDSLGIQ